MSGHHCHAKWCSTECPPKNLMCATHWKLVPVAMASEVYRTVRLRSKQLDHTWAEWWRAQAFAIHHVALIDRPDWQHAERWLQSEIKFADQLAGKGGES